MPIEWLIVIGFGFGAIIGSFLNVAIYRFNTGKSIAGRSHCMSCGKRLSWYELFPLISYVFLNGRCSGCESRITPRYFIVELLTAVLFAVTFTITLDFLEIFLLWLVWSIFVMIVVYDIQHFIIPDILTIFLTIISLALLCYHYNQGTSLNASLWNLAAAAVGSGFFLFLWIISKGRWLGFGDVKLAFPLGLLVGAKAVFSFIVLSFWVGAAVSLCIIGYQRLKRGKHSLPNNSKGLTIKSAVPFAPFLIAGCALVLLYNINVLDFFTFYF